MHICQLNYKNSDKNTSLTFMQSSKSASSDGPAAAFHLLFIQLHGFFDASQSAYADMVYLVTVGNDNQVRITLFVAKTKVPPLTRVTLPRLELCELDPLARVMHKIIDMDFTSINLDTFA